MTSRQLGIMGFALAVLAAVGSVVMVLASTSVQYGKLLSTVEQTQKDVAEIKTTLTALAPPTIKHAGPSTTASSGTAVAHDDRLQPPAEHQPADPADPEPAADWHNAYLRDHCRLCPTCCATAATGDP